MGFVMVTNPHQDTAQYVEKSNFLYFDYSR